MKKIIATVLAMVMALALCTTAFAAEKTYEVYNAETGAEVSTQADATLTYVPANKTNKTIAYYTLNNEIVADAEAGIAAAANQFANKKYVSTTAADAELVLKYSGKTSVCLLYTSPSPRD